MKKEVDYYIFDVKISKLVERFIEITKSINKDNTELVVKSILSDFSDFKNKVKLEIAFIGQYAAGKSSIISALTGDKEIKIGQGITTDIAKQYSWNNIFLVDTPGIYTERKDHDDISIAYMNKADLLVYVITVDGFVDPIGPNFRKIAFEEGLSNKMMLVMNKRSMESQSNEENWVKHVYNVIQPLSKEDLKLVIIDAQDYIEACDSTDIEEKNELITLSNFEMFIEKLNEFLEEKGLIGKLVSPLNLINYYSNILIDSLTSENNNFEKLQEMLRRKQFVVLKSKQKLEETVSSQIRVLYSEIIKRGYRVAEMIGYESDQEIIKQENDNTIEEIKGLCEEEKTKINEIVLDEISNMLKEIDKLSSSELMKDLMGIQEFKLDFNVAIKDKRVKQSFKQAPEILNKFSSFAGKFTSSVEKAGAKGLKAVSGSKAHETALKVGEFFGHKFKPWDAVKYADKFAKVGKVLGVAGLILGPAIALWEEKKEKDYKADLLKTRMEVRNNFTGYAKEVKKEFDEKLKELLNNLHNKELILIDEQSDSLRSTEKNDSAEVKSLNEINQESRKLLGELGKQE
ncbi:MAG: 50S ribosome-binding GTPase [Ignavibacteriae bacterium]|nr:50S ribosome-binding GTPase [Ignavibacteriota bacterium]